MHFRFPVSDIKLYKIIASRQHYHVVETAVSGATTCRFTVFILLL